MAARRSMAERGVWGHRATDERKLRTLLRVIAQQLGVSLDVQPQRPHALSMTISSKTRVI